MNQVGMQITRARASDIPQIVEVHLDAFPDFFLSRLGTPFLHAYYSQVLHFEQGILLVSREEASGQVIGFVAGFTAPAEFYSQMLRQAPRYVLPILRGFLTDHRLIGLVLNRLGHVIRGSRTGNAAKPESDRSGGCELSSIATLHSRQGQGIGRHLLDAFLEEAAHYPVSYIYLTTDAEDNDPVNQFYQRAGFVLSRSFVTGKGRAMNEYRKAVNPDLSKTHA